MAPSVLPGPSWCSSSQPSSLVLLPQSPVWFYLPLICELSGLSDLVIVNKGFQLTQLISIYAIYGQTNKLTQSLLQK